MALLEISFKSKSLDLVSNMIALVPDSAPGPFPVFYLLHGLSGDCTAWLRRTSIERYLGGSVSGGNLDGIPMLVVMPETARGWYTNAASMPPGAVIGAYEDHMIRDVIPFTDRLFPTIPTRQGRVIGGLSMGGYGAVKLALKYPHLFSAATSHSGAVMTPLHRLEERDAAAQSFRPEFESIFGKQWRGGPNDPAALAEKCPTDLRPKLRLDCGRGDFLLAQNRDFHNHLTTLNFPHEYEEFEGAHTWDYWDLHIQDALAFHCRHLGV